MVNAIAKTELVPVDDAVKVGAFIFGVFLPIDVSIWIDIIIDIIKSWFRKTIPADGKDDGN